MYTTKEISLKLSSITNKCSFSFNLNEHGDLVLVHNNSVHIILFNFKKNIIKISIGLKKDMGESVQKNPYYGMQIMTAKTKTKRTL